MNSQIKQNLKKVSFGIFSLVLGVTLGYGFISGGEIIYAKLGRPKIDILNEITTLKDKSYTLVSQLFESSFDNKAEAIDADLNKKEIQKNDITIPVKKEDAISIGFVGDIAPYNAILDQNSNTPQPFSFIKDFLTYPDIMIGNLEGVITKEEKSKCDTIEKNCFTFKGDTIFAENLYLAGFDIMNLANNHAYDFGINGYNDTVKILELNNIKKTGNKDEITIQVINGTKIAFVGFSPHFGSAEFSTENITSLIKKADQDSDIVVMIFHGGGEGGEYMHVKQGEEIYLGENRGDLISLTHTAVDAGADLILGSGPHVLRGMEWYKDKLIVYSLGNFLGNKNLITSGFSGISAILYTNINKEGEILGAELIPISLINGKPKLDIERKSINIINMLSATDFVDSKVTISEDGTIQK